MKADLANLCQELEEKIEIYARWKLKGRPESEKATKSVPYFRLSDRMKPFALSIQKKLAELNVQLYEAKMRHADEDSIQKIEELIREYKEFQKYFEIKPFKGLQDVYNATVTKVMIENFIEHVRRQ